MKKISFGKGLATDSIWLAIAKLMTSLLSIGTAKLLAVGLSLYEYGTYSEAMLIVSAVTSISILGLSDGVNYFFNCNADEKQRQKNVNTVFMLQAIIGTVAAFVIMLSGTKITEYFENPALGGLYIYIMFLPMLTNFSAMYKVLYTSTGRAKAIAIRGLVMAILRLIGVAVATKITKDVATIFLVTLLSDIGMLSYYAISFGRKSFYVNPFDVDFGKIKEIFLYCIPLAAHILTSALSRDVDKYIIRFFTDTETLAIYTNAAKMLPFDLITTSFATVMIPYITRFIARDEFERSQSLYKNYLSFSYVTTWLVAFGAIICAPELMQILYDKKYLAGVGVFIVYIFSDMIRFANVAVILRAKGKTFALLLYSVAMLVVNGGLGIVLFHFFGILGPAIANLTVTLLMNLIMLIHGSKIIKTTLTKLFDFKDMGKTVAGMLLAGGVALGIRSLSNKADIGYVWTFIITYGIYAVIVFILNIKKVLKIMKRMNEIRLD